MTVERLRRLTFVSLDILVLIVAILVTQWFSLSGTGSGYDATTVCMDTYMQQLLYGEDEKKPPLSPLRPPKIPKACSIGSSPIPTSKRSTVRRVRYGVNSILKRSRYCQKHGR